MCPHACNIYSDSSLLRISSGNRMHGPWLKILENVRFLVTKYSFCHALRLQKAKQIKTGVILLYLCWNIRVLSFQFWQISKEFMWPFLVMNYFPSWYSTPRDELASRLSIANFQVRCSDEQHSSRPERHN